MPLSWNEIKSRALSFSRHWADAAHEDSQGKPFWIDFFEIFGITDKRVATFEHAVRKLRGQDVALARVDGFVDLFWPGMLLVEQKSRGKNLEAALTQALPAQEINPYLIDAPTNLLTNQPRNLFGMPEMLYGSKPTDGGHFFMTDDEKQAFLAAEPEAGKFVKSFIGAQEYLHGEKR